MKNILKAKSAFNQKLDELQKETRPAHIGTNMTDIVIYEKLMEVQEQISQLEKRLEKFKPASEVASI